jgi:hypothetical protein
MTTTAEAAIHIEDALGAERPASPESVGALTALAELRVGSEAATKLLRELARSPGEREDPSV